MSSLNNPISTGQVFNSVDLQLTGPNNAGTLAICVSVADANFSASSQILGVKRITVSGVGVTASSQMPSVIITPPVVVADTMTVAISQYKIGLVNSLVADRSTYVVYWTDNVAQSAPCPLNPNGLLSPA